MKCGTLVPMYPPPTARETAPERGRLSFLLVPAMAVDPAADKH